MEAEFRWVGWFVGIESLRIDFFSIEVRPSAEKIVRPANDWPGGAVQERPLDARMNWRRRLKVGYRIKTTGCIIAIPPGGDFP